MFKRIKIFLRLNVLNWTSRKVTGQIVPGNGTHKPTNPVYALGWTLRKKLRMSQFCHISKRYFDPFFDGFYVTFENTLPPKILEVRHRFVNSESCAAIVVDTPGADGTPDGMG